MKRGGIALVLASTALIAWWFWPAAGEVAPAPEGGRSSPERPGGAIPEIGLARLEASRGAASVGKRDLFEFGTRPASEPSSPAPAPEPAAPAPSLPPAPVAVAATPEPPAWSAKLSYIGQLEREGLRVAVLLTEHGEVLTGRAGDLVAQRFTIVDIGLESVDIKDVGSDRVRRLPLKGN